MIVIIEMNDESPPVGWAKPGDTSPDVTSLRFQPAVRFVGWSGLLQAVMRVAGADVDMAAAKSTP